MRPGELEILTRQDVVVAPARRSLGQNSRPKMPASGTPQPQPSNLTTGFSFYTSSPTKISELCGHVCSSVKPPKPATTKAPRAQSCTALEAKQFESQYGPSITRPYSPKVSDYKSKPAALNPNAPNRAGVPSSDILLSNVPYIPPGVGCRGLELGCRA